MRKLVSVAGIAGALVIAACSGDKAVMSDELKKDLAVASSSNAINLATSQQAPGSQVVSAIERTTPPAPRHIASSQRVAKHKAAPRGVAAPVEVQKADVSTEVETQPQEVTPTPVDPAPLPSPRPQPVATTNGSGRDEGRGGGSSIGSVLGGIFTVVIRGGGVDGDNCDPRTEGGRGRVPVSINNRIPVIGTFPGSGRIGGGTFPRGGRTRF